MLKTNQTPGIAVTSPVKSASKYDNEPEQTTVYKLRSGHLRLNRKHGNGVYNSKDTKLYNINKPFPKAKPWPLKKGTYCKSMSNTSNSNEDISDSIRLGLSATVVIDLVGTQKHHQHISNTILSKNDEFESNKTSTIVHRGLAEISETSTDKNMKVRPNVISSSNNKVKDVPDDLDCEHEPELQFCSQEPLLHSSLDKGYECDVMWDEQSTRTFKQVKKFRGQHGTEDIKKSLSNFKDDHVKEQKLVHSVKLNLFSKDHTLSKRSRLQKAKERLPRKCKKRVQNKESVIEGIKWLHDKTAKQNTKNTEGYPNSTATKIELSSEKCDQYIDGSMSTHIQSCNDDNWSDEELFQNTFLIEATKNPEEFFSSSRNTVSLPDTASSNLLCSTDIHQADKNANFHSTVLPQTNESLTSTVELNVLLDSPHSLISNTPSAVNIQFSVKGSCSSSSLLGDTAETCVNECQNIQRQDVYKYCSPEMTTVNHFANNSDKDNFKDVSKPLDIITLTVEGNLEPLGASCYNNVTLMDPKLSTNICKSVSSSRQSKIVYSPFRTVSQTFSGIIKDVLSIEAKDYNFSDSKESSNVNTYRKILNLDKEQSQTNNTDSFYQNNISSEPDVLDSPTKSVPDFKCLPFNEEIKQTHSLPFVKSNSYTTFNNEKVNGNITVTGSCVLNHNDDISIAFTSQEIDFDESLPDDVFQVLQEVEEILHSESGHSSTSMALHTNLSSLCDQNTSVSDSKLDPALTLVPNSNLKHVPSSNLKLDATLMHVPNSIVTDKMSNITLEEEDSSHSYVLRSDITQTSRTQSIESSSNPMLLNSNNGNTLSTHSPKTFTFKKMTPVQRISLQSIKTLKLLQTSLPKPCSPVKYSKTDVSVTEVSFAESVFDDIFMNDEPLFESQIVPVLEEMEAVLVQAESLISSQVKCSPEEIEHKRQAALTRRSQRLSQINKTDRKVYG